MIQFERTKRQTAKCDLFFRERTVGEYKPYVGWSNGTLSQAKLGSYAVVRVAGSKFGLYMTPDEADALASELQRNAQIARESIEAARKRGEIE